MEELKRSLTKTINFAQVIILKAKMKTRRFFKGDLEIITTSSVGKPLGKAPSGIRIIKVYPDRIESIYYGLNDIPQVIIFE